MSDMTEYRIDYTITRRQPDDEDFAEIGFGSSGAWETVGAAEYAMASDIDNYQWETSGDMPDPQEIKTAIEASV
jgi:hypothetical protein